MATDCEEVADDLDGKFTQRRPLRPPLPPFLLTHPYIFDDYGQAEVYKSEEEEKEEEHEEEANVPRHCH